MVGSVKVMLGGTPPFKVPFLFEHCLLQTQP